MESLSPAQVCSSCFFPEGAEKERFTSFEYQRTDKAQFHVKEYQDATKCISEDFFSGLKQMNIKELLAKSTKQL